MSNTTRNNERSLTPYVSPLGAWALSLGTTIGWGSFVVTSNTYLMQGGPWGSVLGITLGAIIMIVIARCYHYLINCYPDAGGAYTYAREAFGHDYGFLASWFLALTYIAVFWANATSVPLFARYFFGNIFQFGFSYTIFGYKVFFGEALLSICAIGLIALLCMRHKNATLKLNTILAIALTAIIVICFVVAITGQGAVARTFEPAFIPDTDALSQIIRIATISPWAFIGFENISHSSEEFTFARSRSFRIMVSAVVAGTILYIFVLLMSTTAFPPEYASWHEYVSDLGNIQGIKALPAFYAAQHFMGNTGIVLLSIALLGLIITSLIGNLLALSRLFYALGKDRILPERFSALGKHDIPVNAILLVAGISFFIPFFGRTAIGWIVDVTTIGATIIYAMVASSAWKTAHKHGALVERWVAFAGLLLMIAFGLYLLIPNLIQESSMEKESYFLFIAWGLLGFLFFRYILHNDEERRFGKSVVVWIGLLSLVLFVSFVWMNQSMMSTSNEASSRIHEYYTSEVELSAQHEREEQFVRAEIEEVQRENERTLMIVAAIFAISLVILLTNYSYMSKRALESERELGHVRTAANTDPLTGVKSKRAFTEYETALDESIHNSVSGPFAVVVCDVNGLKYVNDTFGHKAGDDYIRSASMTICELFMHSPVFRIGGDEFVVVLRERDYDDRASLMQRMRETSESRIGTNGAIIAAGLAEFDEHNDTSMHQVFERADALMYQDKQELKALGAHSR